MPKQTKKKFYNRKAKLTDITLNGGDEHWASDFSLTVQQQFEQEFSITECYNSFLKVPGQTNEQKNYIKKSTLTDITLNGGDAHWASDFSLTDQQQC